MLPTAAFHMVWTSSLVGFTFPDPLLIAPGNANAAAPATTPPSVDGGYGAAAGGASGTAESFGGGPSDTRALAFSQ